MVLPVNARSGIVLTRGRFCGLCFDLRVSKTQRLGFGLRDAWWKVLIPGNRLIAADSRAKTLKYDIDLGQL